MIVPMRRILYPLAVIIVNVRPDLILSGNRVTYRLRHPGEQVWSSPGWTQDRNFIFFVHHHLYLPLYENHVEISPDQD